MTSLRRTIRGAISSKARFPEMTAYRIYDEYGGTDANDPERKFREVELTEQSSPKSRIRRNAKKAGPHERAISPEFF